MIKAKDWNPKNGPITEPCIVKGLPLDVYHGQCCDGPSVSSSSLRRVLEVNEGSPAHFWCEWSGNPQRIEADEEKQHLVLGRAAHHLLLSEQNFQGLFVVRPDRWKDWRTQEAQHWRKQAQEAGYSVLSPNDLDIIKGMAKSLARDPYVEAGALTGQIERSFFWQDKETNLWIKARPDAVPTESGDFADLKTTTSVAYNAVARTVADFAYHQQAALVIEGAAILTGIKATSFTFVFVEKKPPYCVRLVHLREAAIELGHKQNRVARHLIASCLKSKRWPGPGEGQIANVDLGDWYKSRAETDVQAIEQLEQQRRA